jgi:cellulose synthase/poly-beta-1,6-N-acetylglucosamine synthase-like glycosyltransferase
MEALFLTAVTVVVTAYGLYPLGILLLSRTRRELPPAAAPASWPAVSVICAVHNEAPRLDAKIANLLAQGYPGPLQLVFASDGSTDDTPARLQADTRVTALSYAPRRGKAHALKRAVEAATGDILVFTDARQALGAGALQALALRLLDPNVGVVSGSLVHRDPGTRQARDIGLYWRYERAIRMAESRWYSTVGATGALYAMRRRDFEPIADDTVLDDFEIPMQVVRRGRRAVIEPRAEVFDDLQRDVRGERRRKVRTLAGNYQSLCRHPWLWSPRGNPVFWQLLLHKVLRLLVPWALLLAWVASALAAGPMMRGIFWLQSAGYAVALLGMLWEPLRGLPGVSVIVVFVQLNLAAVEGLLQFARGRGVVWEKTA